jgi:arabinogalactan endo-1,4-beta-galactosidase
MKITPETKIKDLIPDGLEINNEGVDIDPNAAIIIRLKSKVETKDFNWYIDTYLRENVKVSCFSLNYNDLMNGNYNKVPFEIKIGLLKFIYDDIEFEYKKHFEVALSEIRSLLRIKTIAITVSGIANEIMSICPKDFLESLFKD